MQNIFVFSPAKKVSKKSKMSNLKTNISKIDYINRKESSSASNILQIA